MGADRGSITIREKQYPCNEGLKQDNASQRVTGTNKGPGKDRIAFKFNLSSLLFKIFTF